MRAIVVILLWATQTCCWGQEPRLFWTDKDEGELESSDLDGGNRVTMLSGLADPRGIVIDRLRGKIYWALHGVNGSIWSADLDGSNPTMFLSGLSEPADLAFNRFSRMLYWAEEGANRILRKCIDDDDSPQLVLEGLNRPYYLALDPWEGFLYWSDFDSTVIHRATLGGAFPEDFITGQSRVRDVEVADGVIYWGDRDSNELRSRATDGTGDGTILFSASDGLDRPHGLVLDPEENTMYWTDTRARTVSSGAMAGTGGATSIASTSLTGAWAVAIWKPQADPHQEWLEENFTSEELDDAESEATVWGDHADPDEDGRVNLLEYAQGTDPRSKSVDRIEVFVEGGEFQVRFRFRADDPLLQFEVESTFDLESVLWVADEIGDGEFRVPDATDSRFEFIQVESDAIDEVGPRLFARLRVSR